MRIRNNIKTLNKILLNTKESYFKFVVNKNSINKINDEIKEILNKINNVEKRNIYLMPMGETTEELDKNSQCTIDLALENGFNYSDRLHIRIWDNKRGV